MIIGIMGSWFVEVEELSRSLASMALDTATFAALCALVLLEGTFLFLF